MERVQLRGPDIDTAEVVEDLFYLLAESIIRFQLLFQPNAGLPDTRIAQSKMPSDTLQPVIRR